MTAFSFTTGNPNNLVANQNASMADIQGPFTDLRSFLNGGTMDETNVPNLAAAFTTYKHIARGRVNFTSAAAAGNTYAFSLGPIATNTQFTQFDVAVAVLELDPTRFAANSRVTKLNLLLTAYPNSVAPAVTFTAGLYQMLTFSGGSGVAPAPATIGTVISGSTAAVASPAATTRVPVASGDFNFPAAGAYIIGVTVSGTPAAGSVTGLTADLSMRQV